MLLPYPVIEHCPRPRSLPGAITSLARATNGREASRKEFGAEPRNPPTRSSQAGVRMKRAVVASSITVTPTIWTTRSRYHAWSFTHSTCTCRSQHPAGKLKGTPGT